MKKKLSLLLAASMLSAMLTMPVHAETASAAMARSSVTGADVVTVTANGADTYEYQWVWRESPTGAYTELPTETAQTYYVSPRDKNRYLNCKITPVDADGNRGTAFYAAQDMQIANLGKQNRTTIKFENGDTPEENMFSVIGYGRKYILLDYFNDEDSAAFVMVDNPQFIRSFDSHYDSITKDDNNSDVYVGTHTHFEPNCETNIGYILNSKEYKETGSAQSFSGVLAEQYTMAQNVMEYINWDHVWWTEQGINDTDDYSFKAGISVLSKSEGDKYMKKIGWNPRKNGTWWWSRTERGNDPKTVGCVMAMKSGAEMWPVGVITGEQVPTVRPCFYLNRDFFKSVRINDIGDNVKKMLVDQYEVAELENLYTDAELKAIGFDVPDRPSITATGGNGVPVVLTASMTVEGAVSYEYQWIKRQSADGAYQNILGDKKQTYSVSTLDKKDYLNCRVTPVYADGSKGTPVTADTDYYVENLGKFSRTDRNTHKFLKDTPAEYTFKVAPDGRRYILLDEFNDKNSAFYVMDDFMYPQTAFDTADSPKFDPTSSTNLGYVLNSEDFKEHGLGGTTLNTHIKDHIDWNHVWWTEQGNDQNENSVIKKDYSFTAGVAVPSMSEMYKYIDKFGYDPKGNSSSWWTRTARGNVAEIDYVLCGCTNGNSSGIPYNEFWPAAANATNIYVRTSYFLDEDFFKEVRLTDIGDEVKKIIKNRYTKAELAGIYDEAELADIGFEPSVSIEETKDGLYHPDDLKVKINYEPANAGVEEVVITASYSGGTTEEIYSDYPEETIAETLTLKKVPFGTTEITITIDDGGNTAATLNKTVYAVPAVESDNGQRGLGSGYNLPLIDRDDATTYVDHIKGLGFNNIRMEFTWRGRAEAVKGEYKTDYFKAVMDRAKENGMSVTALFAYNNPLYSSTSDDKEPIDTETERTAFVNYVKAFVTAYPDLQGIEIWNEPNGKGFWNGTEDENKFTAKDIENYTLLVKTVSEEVRKIAPDINVYAGAIDVSKDAINYIQGMIDNGVYEYMDTLSYHPYYHPSNVDSATRDNFKEDRITPYKDILRKAGGFKRLAATEFGFSNKLFTGYGNDVVKREVPKAYIVMAANGIDSAEVFCYMDDEFGMLKSDGTPQPLMYSMAQLNHALNGTQFIGKLDTDAGVSAYVFEKKGKPVIAAWSSTDSSLSVTGTNVKVYDVYGNAVKVEGNSVALGLDPVYIENASVSYLAEASEDEVNARLAAISKKFTSLPTAVSAAITVGEGVKAAVKASDMTDADKSALLDMYFEVEEIRAAYASIDNTESVSIPTERYASVKAAADNKYAKAAVKYAYDYIEQAKNAVSANALSIAAKNVAAANALLDSAQALSSSAAVPEVAVSDVKVSDGTLTFKVTNTSDKTLEVWVATYAGNTLSSVTKIDNLAGASAAVGSEAGKIFVWEKGNMKPAAATVEFNK